MRLYNSTKARRVVAAVVLVLAGALAGPLRAQHAQAAGGPSPSAIPFGCVNYGVAQVTLYDPTFRTPVAYVRLYQDRCSHNLHAATYAYAQNTRTMDACIRQLQFGGMVGCSTPQNAAVVNSPETTCQAGYTYTYGGDAYDVNAFGQNASAFGTWTATC